VAKKLDGELVQQWLWSGQLRIAAELDGSGNLVAQYIYGNKPNVPELILQGGKTYRIVTDQLGSPVMVVNIEDATDVLFEARYDAWGNRTVLIGDEDAIPFGFAGGLYDADTGLVRFGARDYDPGVGRWTGKDPIVFGGSLSSLYAYVDDDPINRSDQFGLQSRPCSEVCGEIAEIERRECKVRCNVQYSGTPDAAERCRDICFDTYVIPSVRNCAKACEEPDNDTGPWKCITDSCYACVDPVRSSGG